MGTPILCIQGQVKEPSGQHAQVDLLMDSGVRYSVLPEKVWESIGLKAKRQMTFTLVDGTTLERSISEAYVLVFNPFDRTLQPMRMLMC